MTNKKSLLVIIICGIFVVIYALFIHTPTTPIQPVVSNQGDVTDPKKSNIVLRHDGLAAVIFGATEEEVVSTLTTSLGTPTKDTGWIDSFSPYGNCPGEKIRGIEWGSLHVLVGDTPQYGTKTFFGFEYVDRTGSETPLLFTERGITLGATREAIEKAYPDATFGEWLPGQTGTTFVRGGSGSGQYLGGTIENDKLFWIGGGVLCAE